MLFLGRLGRWWRDQDRVIFRYYDGTRNRVADPLQVVGKLRTQNATYLEDLELLGKDVNTVPPGNLRADLTRQREDAILRLIQVSRSVFNIPGLTEQGGLTDAEVIGVLTSFFAWMEHMAQEAAPFATSPPPE